MPAVSGAGFGAGGACLGFLGLAGL